VVSTLAGSWQLLELMPPRFSFLSLYSGASLMLLAHFALQLLCITFNAPTNSQSGTADMRRPPINHIKPPLGEPSGPFFDPPYAPRQYYPHALSALPLLCMSRGILYGRPAPCLLGSINSSAVWYPAARRWGTAFEKACSPVHSRSHCSLSMCHTPASH
jgi:hypothetical protein